MMFTGSDLKAVTLTKAAIWVGRLLMGMVAGEDLRVRSVIANAVTVTRPRDDPASGRRYAGYPDNH